MHNPIVQTSYWDPWTVNSGGKIPMQTMKLRWEAPNPNPNLLARVRFVYGRRGRLTLCVLRVVREKDGSERIYYSNGGRLDDYMQHEARSNTVYWEDIEDACKACQTAFEAFVGELVTGEAPS